MRILTAVAALVLLSVLWTGTSRADRDGAPRLALVIGNAAYRHAEPLRNPVNDAEAVAATLAGVGFRVTKVIDADHAAMTAAIGEFGGRLDAAGPDAVGLVYYAGHAVESRGRNFLIPVDAGIERESELSVKAVAAAVILEQMEFAGNDLNVLILDSCRNNPFSFERTRGTVSRGLAAIERKPRGTLIAYAAAPGEAALDGDGRNSPYATALVRAIGEPGLEIGRVFRRVREIVLDSTRGRQTPWEESSLTGAPFYFAEPEAAAPQPAPSAGNGDLAYWDRIKDSEDPRVFEAFLRVATDPVVLALARSRLDGLRAAPAIPAVGVTEQPEPTQAHASGSVFRDCDDCPVMVAVPGGRFLMGSPGAEPERKESEGPRHLVTVPAFALGKYEVTVGEFRRFVEATGYDATGHDATGRCWVWSAETRTGAPVPGKNWRDPGFAQGAAEPVVCVNWEDAQAYVDWIGARAGVAYRLPSEAEWEYAARAESHRSRYWGDRPDLACRYANVYDRTGMEALGVAHSFHECDDGAAHTATVGRYRANAFGLHDMMGNVWEWVEDCWFETYDGAPTDARAWTLDTCERHVARGGSWVGVSREVRSATRNRLWLGSRQFSVGFRVARDLAPTP